MRIIAEEIPFDNVKYDHNKGAFIVMDNNSSTGDQLKQLYPYEPVYLYDSITRTFTRHTISYIHRTPRMKNGVLTVTEETISI